MEKSQNMLYTINLPDGITNQTGVNEATVSIQFSGLSTREYTVDNFEAINVPEGMEVEIINASLTVRVRGAAGQISQLTGDDIKVVVDFSNAVAGTATYKASITFGEEFTAVGAIMGPYSVSATVRGDGMEQLVRVKETYDDGTALVFRIRKAPVPETATNVPLRRGEGNGDVYGKEPHRRAPGELVKVGIRDCPWC